MIGADDSLPKRRLLTGISSVLRPFKRVVPCSTVPSGFTLEERELAAEETAEAECRTAILTLRSHARKRSSRLSESTFGLSSPGVRTCLSTTTATPSCCSAETRVERNVAVGSIVCPVGEPAGPPAPTMVLTPLPKPRVCGCDILLYAERKRSLPN